MKKTFHIPVFVPHKGCPHDCVFCNQKKITGQLDEMTPQKAKEIIESHLETIENNYKREDCHIEIAFFGGSFTAIEKESMISLLQLAGSYVQSKRADGIRCSTRPDCISPEILTICKKYGMTCVELGVQSADEEVLRLSNRGHDFDDVKKASKLIKEYEMELGLQMMTGLPGDTPEKSEKTARDIASLFPDCVRIYPTLVMDGTHLFKMYENGLYCPQTLDDALNLASKIASYFKERGITVLRIGLQTTDGVNRETVIGPYHEAFAELVYSKMMREKIEKEYLLRNDKNKTDIKIFEYKTTPQKVSQAVGHKGENKKYFKEKYGIDLKIVTN